MWYEFTWSAYVDEEKAWAKDPGSEEEEFVESCNGEYWSADEFSYEFPAVHEADENGELNGAYFEIGYVHGGGKENTEETSV